MNRKKLLKKVANQDISPLMAYNRMYCKSIHHRAHFCKIQLKVEDVPICVHWLMKSLLFFPLPIFIAKWSLCFIKSEEVKQNRHELNQLISYSKGTDVDIKPHTENVRVRVKIF